MDPPKRPPSGGKDDMPESVAAAAALHPAGDISPSLPSRPLDYASVSHALCAQDAAAIAEPPSHSHLGAMTEEKRSVSPTEYDLFASRLRRKRTRARPVVAIESPTSVIKVSTSAARNEVVLAGDQNPNISAAAASNVISKKSDHHGAAAASNVISMKSDHHGAAAASNVISMKSDHHGAAAASNVISMKSDHHGAAGEAASAGGGGYSIGRLASYKRMGVLGEGGFGTVCKARDTRTGELVAVKSGKKVGDGATLLNEAALLAACRSNPAVVGLREVVRGQGADDVHIVLDFPGRSLRDLLNTRRRFTESETRKAMRELLAGVEKMGAQGIVHGDLKPENVLVRKSDGCLMICDFGLAVCVSAPPRHIDGTLHYSAPEQLLGEKNCGPAVDAWALGCIMAELLTGEPLVQAYNAVEQLMDTVILLAVPDAISQMSFQVDESARSELRDRVPDKLLTPSGFDVLQGLMQYLPEVRLTPAAALQMPWFAAEDTSVVSSVEPKPTPRQ